MFLFLSRPHRGRVALEGKDPVGDLYPLLRCFCNKTFNTTAGFDLFIADTDSFNPVETSNNTRRFPPRRFSWDLGFWVYLSGGGDLSKVKLN